MCLFCKIVEKEIPATIIKENSDFIAFEDINPQALIHILIIPKKHYDSFQDVDISTMSDITKFIQELAVELKINNDGYKLITNIGENGGQEVKHLHFHLLAGEI